MSLALATFGSVDDLRKTFLIRGTDLSFDGLFSSSSGRAGSKITEIRRLSGSKISIAKVPHDETGERMFTIVGSPESKFVPVPLCVILVSRHIR